jgi:general secretion pathway protein L
MLLFFNNSRLLDVITFDWGGKDIAETIARQYSISFIEGLKELKTKGYILLSPEGAQRDQVLFSDTIKSAIDSLANRARLALAEAEAKHHAKISRIQITGGLSLLKNLGAYLTQRFEVPCNKLVQIEDHPEIDLIRNPQSDSSALIAIGLALEGLKRPKNPALNLLRGDMAKARGGMSHLWQTWRPVAIPVLTLFAIFTVWSFLRSSIAAEIYSRADSRIRNMGREIIGLKGPQVTLKNIRNYIAEQNMKLKQRELLESLEGVESSMDVLKAISAVAPGKTTTKINVTKLLIRTDRVEIEGYSDRNDAIENFRKALLSQAQGGVIEFSQETSTPVDKSRKPFTFRYKLANRVKAGVK